MSSWYKSEEEVLPGVFLTRGVGAPPPQLAQPVPVQEMDLHKVYQQIDAAVHLINRLSESNVELLSFFASEKAKNPAGEDDSDASSSSSSSEDADHNNDGEGDEDDDDDAEGAGACMDMNSLLAMDGNTDRTENDAAHDLRRRGRRNNSNNADGADEDDAGVDDEGDDDDDAAMERRRAREAEAERRRKRKEKNRKKFDGDNPDPVVMSKLPEDIQEAILENLEIMAQKKREVEELINHTMVKSHKCGMQRVHGAPPPEQNDL